MYAISQRFYQQLLQELSQRPIRCNRYKVSLFTPLHGDPAALPGSTLTEHNTEQTVFAFNIMFERNNPQSDWRLVTPLRFTE
ncbi:hypothetical protein [Spirosoma pomorum]|jgi:hypothetical protein